MKRHNPELSAFRGLSYKKHSERIDVLKDKELTKEFNTYVSKDECLIDMWEEDTLRNHTFMSLDGCPFCEKGKINSSMVGIDIPHDFSDCKVFVYECNLCKKAFTNSKELRDEAIKKYLEKKGNHESD